MNYILKSKTEGDRLDRQTDIQEFSLASELRGIEIPSGSRVLDAGCGSGVLCRYLQSTYRGLKVSGCDASEKSLSHARLADPKKETNFFSHDFVLHPFEEKYDVIFNRLVAHHLGEKLPAVFANFHKALRAGGKLIVIDTDGLFVNLATTSKALQEKMSILQTKFHGNLHAGRLSPSLLTDAGFSSISWRIETMDFHGESRKLEVEQWKERFESSLDFYVQVLGSEFEARKFFREYVQEASKETVPLFYNKFIIEALK